MMIENEINYESIIGLSKKPIEDITSLTETFTKNLNMYKNAPSVIRPFLKKDIETFTNLKEEDWLNFLIRLNTSLKKMQELARINNAEKDKKLERAHLRENKEERLELDNYNLLSSFEKMDSLLIPREKNQLNKNVYCPECGHQCQSKIELKNHIINLHKNDSDKLLKSIKLYKL